MNLTRLLLAGIATFLLMGCDPIYTIQYQIDNQTEDQVEIIIEDEFNGSQDTVRIAQGATGILTLDEGIGSARPVYESFDSIRVIFRSIRKDTAMYQPNPRDLARWNFQSDRRCCGTTTLTVTELNFR